MYCMYEVLFSVVRSFLGQICDFLFFVWIAVANAAPALPTNVCELSAGWAANQRWAAYLLCGNHYLIQVS